MRATAGKKLKQRIEMLERLAESFAGNIEGYKDEVSAWRVLAIVGWAMTFAFAIGKAFGIA